MGQTIAEIRTHIAHHGLVLVNAEKIRLTCRKIARNRAINVVLVLSYDIEFKILFVFIIRIIYFYSIKLSLYNEILGTPNPDPNPPNPQPPSNCPAYRAPPYSGTIFNFPNVVKATGYF